MLRVLPPPTKITSFFNRNESRSAVGGSNSERCEGRQESRDKRGIEADHIFGRLAAGLRQKTNGRIGVARLGQDVTVQPQVVLVRARCRHPWR